MKKLKASPYLLLVLLFLLLAAFLGISPIAMSVWLSARTPRSIPELWLFESYPRYHLRQLSYHGSETKDGVMQRVHSEALISHGQSGADVILDMLESGRTDWPFSPGPFTMLRRIGEPATESISSREQDLSKGPNNEESKRVKFVLAVTELIVQQDDSLLPSLLESICDTGPQISQFDRRRLVLCVELYLHDKYEEDIPPILADQAECAVNPFFVDWYSRRIGPGERQQGDRRGRE